jgi:hypothetical protein
MAMTLTGEPKPATTAGAEPNNEGEAGAARDLYGCAAPASFQRERDVSKRALRRTLAKGGSMDALQQVQALRVDDVVRVYYDLDRQKVQELRV